jgi:hypothetical protein
MFAQLVVAAITYACTIAIHAIVMLGIVRMAQRIAVRTSAHPSVLLVGMMVATVSVLSAAHVVEVMVWALVYAIVGVAPAGTGVMYFAFVNYTTLGYGDIIPVDRWRLLGPMTAMNGILLFGWSTAVIFDVLRKTLAQEARNRPAGEGIDRN